MLEMLSIGKVRALFIVLISLIYGMLVSCNSEKNFQLEPGRDTQVKVVFNGVAFEELPATTRGNYNRTWVSAFATTSLGRQGNGSAFAEGGLMYSSLSIEDPKLLKEANPFTRKTSDLGININYRMLVYLADGSLLAQEQFNSEDKNASIALNSGEELTFVVYSFGNSSNIPEVSPDSKLGSEVLKGISGDADFLYSKFTKKFALHSDNFLSIVLRYQMAKITVAFETPPDMGVMTAVDASLGMHYPQADFHFANNSLVPKGTGKMLPLSIKETGSLVKSEAVVLCGVSASGKILKINSITLNGMTQPIIGTALGQMPNQSLQELTDFEIRAGYSYTLKVSFQASGIQVGNLVWAKGNLAKVNGIYFNRHLPEECGWIQGINYHSPDFIQNARYHTDYWTFDSFEPIKSLTEYYPTNTHPDAIKAVVDDPCIKVTGGRWRMPTIQEFTNLGTLETTLSPGVKAQQPNGNPKVDYIWWNGHNELTKAPERLRFYAAGRGWGLGDHPTGLWNIYHMQYHAIDAHMNLPSCVAGYDTYVAGEEKFRNPETGGCTYRSDTPLYRGTLSGDTFVSDRKFENNLHYSRDERLPIRCVRDVL